MRFGVEGKKIFIVALIIIAFLITNACAQTQEQKMKMFDAHEEKARNYRIKGNHQAALQEQLKAVELNPENAGSQIILGNIYIELEQWDKAIETLQKATELDAKDERGFYLLALALEGKGEKGKAIESLQKAIKIKPEDTLFLAKLAYLYDEIGNKNKAKEIYNQILVENPNYTDVIYNLAILEEGNTEKAIYLYEKVLNLEKEDKEMLRRAREKLEILKSKKSNKL